MKPLVAQALLAAFAEAGVLTAADVHVAVRLGALTGETDDRVLLAAALTVRGTRQGSVVLDVATAAETVAVDDDEGGGVEVALPWPKPDAWVAACAASPLVAGSAGASPLRAVGSRLWLDRYWGQEVQVASDLRRRVDDPPADLEVAGLALDLDELFPAVDADQRRAVEAAVTSRIAVIAGGPGTGKTTTVARLIAVLRRRLGPGVRIALAAPTAVAAARLETAVRGAGAPLTADDRAALGTMSASTLHRLLGWRPDSSSRFRHDRDHHLPYDVVVVDEASMVSLTMTARLLEALPPAARLVLVGDPDQLASVEAGAVLGDIVGGLETSVATLRRDRRYSAEGPIAQLAALVRAGDADAVLDLLRSGVPEVRFDEVADDDAIAGEAAARLRAAVVSHETGLLDAARAGDAVAALSCLDQFRVICAHRAGPRGVRHWGDLAERWLSPAVGTVGRLDGRYPGQPLLVTSNDYEINLFNGDSGVVLDDRVAVFRRGGAPFAVPLTRLGDVRPLHAMTIHRAQGSQFTSVTVLLPLASSPLATRQTFYTAVTRASGHVHVVGSAESVVACVHTPAARATGLRDRLRPALVRGPGREQDQLHVTRPGGTA